MSSARVTFFPFDTRAERRPANATRREIRAWKSRKQQREEEEEAMVPMRGVDGSQGRKGSKVVKEGWRKGSKRIGPYPVLPFGTALRRRQESGASPDGSFELRMRATPNQGMFDEPTAVPRRAPSSKIVPLIRYVPRADENIAMQEQFVSVEREHDQEEVESEDEDDDNASSFVRSAAPSPEPEAPQTQDDTLSNLKIQGDVGGGMMKYHLNYTLFDWKDYDTHANASSSDGESAGLQTPEDVKIALPEIKQEPNEHT
jgi:hypothetical protein